MRVLVVGSGAREHALVWKFARSNRISDLYAAPGNAGTIPLASTVNADPMDNDALCEAALERKIDLVFVGPEAPLSNGLADALTERGIAVVGPDRSAARLESSKAFSKAFMRDARIPTAAFESFGDYATCERYIRRASGKIVVKKSGLAAGKGVFESDDTEQLLRFARNVMDEGDEVVVEEHLTGYEVSVFALADGKSFRTLPACTDYKKAGVGSTGPNTGGMGAICPVPWLEADVEKLIETRIVEPTFKALAAQGIRYRGILYFGIMVTSDGPYLLEYNVRFGDPEAQVLLPLIETDFAEICSAIAEERVETLRIQFSDRFGLGVVIAAPGYPSTYPKDLPVDPLPQSDDEALVFHASTRMDGDQLITGGGRCFTVVGIGSDLLEARARAYQRAKDVTFPGSWMRQDIGGRIFGA